MRVTLYMVCAKAVVGEERVLQGLNASGDSFYSSQVRHPMGLDCIRSVRSGLGGGSIGGVTRTHCTEPLSKPLSWRAAPACCSRT